MGNIVWNRFVSRSIGRQYGGPIGADQFWNRRGPLFGNETSGYPIDSTIATGHYLLPESSPKPDESLSWFAQSQVFAAGAYAASIATDDYVPPAVGGEDSNPYYVAPPVQPAAVLFVVDEEFVRSASDDGDAVFMAVSAPLRVSTVAVGAEDDFTPSASDDDSVVFLATSTARNSMVQVAGDDEAFTATFVDDDPGAVFVASAAISPVPFTLDLDDAFVPTPPPPPPAPPPPLSSSEVSGGGGYTGWGLSARRRLVLGQHGRGRRAARRVHRRVRVRARRL